MASLQRSMARRAVREFEDRLAHHHRFGLRGALVAPWRRKYGRPKTKGSPTTFWNGEPCPARRVMVTVADDPAFPHYWARAEGLIGREIPAVEVHYAGQMFYLDNRTGSGWAKVTVGRGSPQIGHSNVTVAGVRAA